MSSFSGPLVCCVLYFLWWWNCCLLYRLLACMPYKHWCASALLALCLLLLDPDYTFLLFRYPEPCFSLPKASSRLSVPLFLRQCFVLILQYNRLLLFSVDNCSSVVVKPVQGCWTCRLLAVVWYEHCFLVSRVYSNQVPLLVVLPIVVVVSSLLYTWSCRCKAMCRCNYCCLSFWCVSDDQAVALLKGCEFQVHVLVPWNLVHV